MRISPAKALQGTVRVPGDKSVSHRAVMIGSIADGVTRITNFSPGEDCASTLRCMRALGVMIEQDRGELIVHGAGKHGLKNAAGELDCGNSGTTMRLLAGILAGQPFEAVLTGDGSLRSRPMERIIEPLSLMGSEIAADNGFAPLKITGRDLRGIDYETPVPSAQIKSCMLLAGLFAGGETSVIESVKSRDHTERMLRAFGVDVRETFTERGSVSSVSGDAKLTASDIAVPADISSAAFFFAAAACLSGSQVQVRDVGVNPTRSSIIDVMRSLGADIQVGPQKDEAEPIADVSISGGLTPTDEKVVLAGSDVAKIIDEVPILAVMATQADKGLEVRGAGELRIKESDRIASIVQNLQRMGADITEFEDGFRVERSNLKGASIDSCGDHRIAMAFAVAGLLAEGRTEIRGHECADVSYPGFFEQLEAIAQR